MPLIPERSGVYRTPEDQEALRKQAGGAAVLWIEADLGRVSGKSAILNTIARALEFPAHFGANWDALLDSLRDLSWRPARGYVVHLRGVPPAEHSPDVQTLLGIFEDAANYWRSRGQAFVVLVDDADGLPPWKPLP